MSNILIIVAVVVVIIIVGFYFYNKNKQTKIAADTSIATIAVNAPVECTPFTAEQQKKEKRYYEKACAASWLIPLVGPKAYKDCLEGIPKKLTPIKSC